VARFWFKKDGFWLWACASLVLHAPLLLGPLVSRAAERVSTVHAPSQWISAVKVEPPPPSPPRVEPPPPPPPPPPRERAKVEPRRVAHVQPTAEPASAAAPSEGLRVEGEGSVAIASGDGGVAVGEGDGNGGSGPGGDGDGTGTGTAQTAAEPQRARRPAELSLWMDVETLGSRALVRPGLGFLMAVPGLREALRGSGIRPFIDLRSARIRLAGRAPERLTLAGTHTGGERALLAAAEQTAAMRGRQLNWRGDDTLRASSWVDGSGVDRGLALHGDAFVIAERSAMPALLAAQQPGLQVRALSQLREHAVLALAVEDAALYFPGMQPCELDAVRLSIATSGTGYRLALTAQYRRPSAASAAPHCLREHTASPDPLSRLVDWLERAESKPESHTTSLKIGVTGDDVEQLLNGLAWALRPAH
jgi:hypothetical protein